MKKYIFALLLALVLISPAYAQTPTVSEEEFRVSLIQQISILTEIVNKLVVQLQALIVAQTQNTSPSVPPLPPVTTPTTTPIVLPIATSTPAVVKTLEVKLINGVDKTEQNPDGFVFGGNCQVAVIDIFVKNQSGEQLNNESVSFRDPITQELVTATTAPAGTRGTKVTFSRYTAQATSTTESLGFYLTNSSTTSTTLRLNVGPSIWEYDQELSHYRSSSFDPQNVWVNGKLLGGSGINVNTATGRCL